MNFDIKTEQLSGDAYVISLTGEVDLYTAPEFKQQLLEVIGQGGKEVVVDFSGTTFIDSTTLGVLVGGVKRLRTNDGQLSLVCSDRNITKIFEITGLDKVFTIYPDARGGRLGAGSSARLKRRVPGRGPGGRARGGRAARRRLRHGRRGERRRAAPDTQQRPDALHSRAAGRATRSRRPARAGRSARTSTTRSRPTSQEGYPQSAIENVVLDQIRLGSGPIATYTTSKDFVKHAA